MMGRGGGTARQPGMSERGLSQAAAATTANAGSHIRSTFQVRTRCGLRQPALRSGCGFAAPGNARPEFAMLEQRRTAPPREKVRGLKFHPLTPSRWKDLEKLFGPRGACGGCWCMFWRLRRSQFQKQKGEQNKRALKRVVESGDAPGLLAYVNGEAVGWCAIAPREAYPALARSRLLQPLDGQPVSSVSCLFVAKPHRRKGLSTELLKAVIDYVRRRGGRIVEGYPQAPRKDDMPDVFAWTGLASAFRQAGFKECLRRSVTRPIMRFEINA